MSSYKKRYDGRKFDEMRPIKAQVGVIPNADGSARFSFGNTKAIAAVYGPKQLHPQHMQIPDKGLLRCNYTMMSFSVTERIKPGPSRRSQEISKVTEWALSSIVDLERFPSAVIDVHIMIEQADASTRCAGINAAVMALVQAGIPMKEMASSVSIGKCDETIVTDVSKEEEDYEDGEGATDMPFTILSNTKRISHLQLDGKVSQEKFSEAIKAAMKATEKIHEIQVKALKNIGEVIEA